MQLATVTSTSPLAVRRVGDTVDAPATAMDVAVVAGDQVLTENIDNTVFVIAKLGGSTVPTGTPLPWLTATAPSGFLLCQFQAVSRTTYSGLNAVAVAAGYASPWGPGDGSTTFNVPDGRGRAFIGAGTFAALGVTDGLAEASRTLRHIHPITNEVAHQHGINNTSHTGASNTTQGGASVGERVNAINGVLNGNHSHGGNTQTGGAHDHTGNTGQSALNAIPFFAGNWIIKT